MKPVVLTPATEILMNIVNESYPTEEIKITAGESKRIELIRKMKGDTDNKDYMLMLNALVFCLTLTSIGYFIFIGDTFPLVCSILGVLYFMFIRYRLKQTTQKLVSYKTNFDKYLWEGFYLKEMRFNAVKLAYLLFFPCITFFTVGLFYRPLLTLPLLFSVISLVLISSVGWVLFFNTDQKVLDNFESDLKSLEYLK